MYPTLALFIGGKWISGGGRFSQPVVNPATLQTLGMLPHASKADLGEALEAAATGFRVWKSTSVYERARLMCRAADLIRERQEYIARVVTLEEGKILDESRREVAVAADIVQACAEEGKRAYGRIVPSRSPGTRQMVIQEPVGPVAAFAPWNFPAVTPARKISGALGSGCSIIIKAAEEAPGACIELVRAFADAGLPPGTLNLVFGVPSEVSEFLIPSDVIRKISFTGSVTVGKHLASMASRHMKRATMELGGHSPVIVNADVDVNPIAEMLAKTKFRNAGQICISPTRFFVHESIAEEFTASFVRVSDSLRLGNGLDPASGMGPLANARRVEFMECLVGDVLDRGGDVVYGGLRHGDCGHFFQPTVVNLVSDDARIMREEPFGPIVPVVTFTTLEDAVARANSVPYGLAAYAFTNSLKAAGYLSEAIEAGMVGINTMAVSTPETPFGGVKDSGFGQEGGIEGLDAYTVKKFVAQA